MSKELIFYPGRCNPPQLGAIAFDNIEIPPGRKTVEEPYLSVLLNHPDLPRYEKWGAIEWITPTDVVDVETPKGDSLAEFSIEDAEKLIETEHDAETLQKWLKLEQRRGLRQSINRRITQIKGGNE